MGKVLAVMDLSQRVERWGQETGLEDQRPASLEYTDCIVGNN